MTIEGSRLVSRGVMGYTIPPLHESSVLARAGSSQGQPSGHLCGGRQVVLRLSQDPYCNLSFGLVGLSPRSTTSSKTLSSEGKKWEGTRSPGIAHSEHSCRASGVSSNPYNQQLLSSSYWGAPAERRSPGKYDASCTQTAVFGSTAARIGFRLK